MGIACGPLLPGPGSLLECAGGKNNLYAGGLGFFLFVVSERMNSGPRLAHARQIRLR